MDYDPINWYQSPRSTLDEVRCAPVDPSLPPPWKEVFDVTTGRFYYWNTETNVTQFDKPAYQVPFPSFYPFPYPEPVPMGNTSVPPSSALFEPPPHFSPPSLPTSHQTQPLALPIPVVHELLNQIAAIKQTITDFSNTRDEALRRFQERRRQFQELRSQWPCRTTPPTVTSSAYSVHSNPNPSSTAVHNDVNLPFTHPHPTPQHHSSIPPAPHHTQTKSLHRKPLKGVRHRVPMAATRRVVKKTRRPALLCGVAKYSRCKLNRIHGRWVVKATTSFFPEFDEEFCQLSMGPTAVAATSPPTATNPSSPPIFNVPEQHEVSLSVAVPEEASFTSSQCKRDDVVVPNGVALCAAFASASALDPTVPPVLQFDTHLAIAVLRLLQDTVDANDKPAQLPVDVPVDNNKHDNNIYFQSPHHFGGAFPLSLRFMMTPLSAVNTLLQCYPSSIVRIDKSFQPTLLDSIVLVAKNAIEKDTYEISVVNLDWRCDKIVKLYVMLQSFRWKDGALKFVVVYSSNLGIELIEAEETHSYAGLFGDKDDVQAEDLTVIFGSAPEMSHEDRNKVNVAATGKNPVSAQLTIGDGNKLDDYAVSKLWLHLGSPLSSSIPSSASVSGREGITSIGERPAIIMSHNTVQTTALVTSRVITSGVTVSIDQDSLVGILLVNGVRATENVSPPKAGMLSKSKEPRQSYHHTKRGGDVYPGSLRLCYTDMVPFSLSQHLYAEEKVDEDAAYLVVCSYHGNKYFITTPNPTKWNISDSLQIYVLLANYTKESSPKISLSSVTSESLAFESFTRSNISGEIAMLKASDPSNVLKVVTTTSVQQLTILVVRIDAYYHSTLSLMDASVLIFCSHFSNNEPLFIMSCNAKPIVKALPRYIQTSKMEGDSVTLLCKHVVIEIMADGHNVFSGITWFYTLASFCRVIAVHADPSLILEMEKKHDEGHYETHLLESSQRRLFFLQEHVLFRAASPSVLRIHHHVLPRDKSIHPANYHFEGEHSHRILIFFVRLVVDGSIVARALVIGLHPNVACILSKHHSLVVGAAIIMRMFFVAAVLYTPLCATDFVKSISEFYPLRYSSDSLEHVVIFMTNMHKTFQHVGKAEFVLTMSSSSFNLPTRALVRKLVSLLLVAVNLSPPVLANMLREVEKLILGTPMVCCINELLPLQSKQQGLDIGIHYRRLAFVSSSHLLNCSEREALGIISIMQHLYDWQSTSNSHESVHLSTLLHTWQVTTGDAIDFGATLTPITVLNMKYSTSRYLPLFTCDPNASPKPLGAIAAYLEKSKVKLFADSHLGALQATDWGDYGDSSSWHRALHIPALIVTLNGKNCLLAAISTRAQEWHPGAEFFLCDCMWLMQEIFTVNLLRDYHHGYKPSMSCLSLSTLFSLSPHPTKATVDMKPREMEGELGSTVVFGTHFFVTCSRPEDMPLFKGGGMLGLLCYTYVLLWASVLVHLNGLSIGLGSGHILNGFLGLVVETTI